MSKISGNNSNYLAPLTNALQYPQFRQFWNNLTASKGIGNNDSIKGASANGNDGLSNLHKILSQATKNNGNGNQGALVAAMSGPTSSVPTTTSRVTNVSNAPELASFKKGSLINQHTPGGQTGAFGNNSIINSDAPGSGIFSAGKNAENNANAPEAGVASLGAKTRNTIKGDKSGIESSGNNTTNIASGPNSGITSWGNGGINDENGDGGGIKSNGNHQANYAGGKAGTITENGNFGSAMTAGDGATIEDNGFLNNNSVKGANSEVNLKSGSAFGTTNLGGPSSRLTNNGSGQIVNVNSPGGANASGSGTGGIYNINSSGNSIGGMNTPAAASYNVNSNDNHIDDQNAKNVNFAPGTSGNSVTVGANTKVTGDTTNNSVYVVGQPGSGPHDSGSGTTPATPSSPGGSGGSNAPTSITTGATS